MEQYLMAKKALLFKDSEMEKKIMTARDPKEIKALGRSVSGYREDLWSRFKYRIVLTGSYYKFSQHKDLREYLLGTEPCVLVESSPVDFIWGIGMSQDNPEVCNPAKWRGKNFLGFALMKVRNELQRVWGNYSLINWSSFD